MAIAEEGLERTMARRAVAVRIKESEPKLETEERGTVVEGRSAGVA